MELAVPVVQISGPATHCHFAPSAAADRRCALAWCRRQEGYMKTFAGWMAASLMAMHPGMAQAQQHAQYSAEYLETTKDWGSVVADFNNDGHDDFFISGHDETDRVWYWSPTGYVPGPQVFMMVDRHDCDAADFNRDGRMDIYCAVGALQGTGKGFNELWLQRLDGNFRKTADHGAYDIYGRGRIPVAFDFNHDGYPDIYVTNEATERPDGQPNINHVFVNQGNAKFVEALTLATGARGFLCAVKGDINGDGWDDLAVCDRDDVAHLYINNRQGDFVELASPALAARWRDAALADMNGDGRDDLVLITTQNYIQIWLNGGEGNRFETLTYQSKPVFTPQALSVGDFNADGLKDVYVVLRQSGCLYTYQDIAPDLIYQGKPGGGWFAARQPETYPGCGYKAATLDVSRVLLMQGGMNWTGGNYVISWSK